MADYLPEQLEAIRKAVREARAAMQQASRYEPLDFARVFIRHDGIQIPGTRAEPATCTLLAQALLRSLQAGRPVSDDETVRRELRRARTEARWARLSMSDKVVGFYLKLGPLAQLSDACRELLAQDYGLGAAVFPKAKIVVLPPQCVDYEFVPMHEDEVEQ
jgi:hypothetical protein